MNIFKQHNNLDAMLVSGKANKFYFKNRYSERGYVLLIKDEDKPVLFVDYRSIQEFKGQDNVIILKKDDNPLQVVAKYASDKNIKLLGFEANDMTYDKYSSLKTLVKCDLAPIILDELRYIKNDEEITKIKNACKVTDDTFNYIKQNIKIGMREVDVASLIDKTMIDFGADSLAFATIVASGNNSSNPHAKPSRKKIEYGDIVTMDFGAKKDGYCSDMTRTIFIGEASNPKLVEIYNEVLKSHKAVATSYKTGMQASDLDSIARESMKSSGYDKYFVHHLGHSLGIECHEEPRLAANEKIVIENGMVFTNEPGIYVDGLGGVRIENTFYINDGQYVPLHESSIELYVTEVNDEK